MAQTPRPSRPNRIHTQKELNSTAAESAFEDWRFAHTAPAALISVNIASLVQSPIWTILFPALGSGGSGWTAEDLNKARSTLSDMGQVLISVADGGRMPSMLILARGNLDGPLRSLMNPSDGMQAERLNAITMLMGDPQGLSFANLRLRSPYAQAGLSRLHQDASQAFKYDLWLGIDPGHFGSLASTYGGPTNPTVSALRALRAVSVGIYLRDQIRVEAALEAPSPDMAERMLAAFQQMQAKAQEKGPNPFGGQVWFSTEGSKLRLIEIVDANALKAIPGLDAAMAQMIGPQIAPAIRSLAAMGAPQPAPPASTGKGAIVIQGR